MIQVAINYHFENLNSLIYSHNPIWIVRCLSQPEIAFRRVLIHPTNVRQSIVGWKFSAASPTSGDCHLRYLGTLQYLCPLLTLQRYGAYFDPTNVFNVVNSFR